MIYRKKQLDDHRRRSNTGIVGSNPTRGMNVSAIFSVVVSCK